MMKPVLRAFAAGLIAISLTTSASASANTDANTNTSPQIKDSKEVFHRLLTMAVGNEIKDNCPTIKMRSVAATFYFLGLIQYTYSLGFSRAQMDAYRNDPEQQDRLRKAAYSYLDKHGVNRKDPASYCPLGMAEITRNTEIGKLLKSR